MDISLFTKDSSCNALVKWTAMGCVSFTRLMVTCLVTLVYHLGMKLVMHLKLHFDLR